MPKNKKAAAKSSEQAEASTQAKAAPASEKPPKAARALAKRREREEVKEPEGHMARRRRGSRAAVGNDGLGGEEDVKPPVSPPGRARSGDEDAFEEELGRQAEKYLDAVVKVFCVHSEPNYSLPWQRKRQFASTSSGFIIPGRRILTNAHSVDHHTQVKVRRRGQDTKFIARVLAQGPECDIALLTVEDPTFWEGTVTEVRFGKLPRLQDSVAVIGYPIGGDSISASSGVVSRIEVTNYSHGATALLGMQIDAAINSGNSGGPAFNARGECVGIAFQSLKGEDAELIGYVIPVDVVEHFITDFDRNGRFTSFPLLGVEWQRMESPFLRKACGMQPGQKGVLIRGVEPTAEAAAHLRKGDVLLEFDGTPIANDGTVQFRSGERISFSYLISKKFVGDEASLRVLRDGKVLELRLRLSKFNRLIPEHLNQRPPSYFVIAGFVFTEVTAPFLRSEYGKDYEYDAPVKLLNLLMHGKARRPDEQVVVLGHVLAAECTVGWEDMVNHQVLRVNGQGINSLRDLVAIVDSAADEFLKFELECDLMVVIETAVARAATADVLAMHLITHDRSEDLRKAEAAVANGNGSAAGEGGKAKKGRKARRRAAAAKAGGGEEASGE